MTKPCPCEYCNGSGERSAEYDDTDWYGDHVTLTAYQDCEFCLGTGADGVSDLVDTLCARGGGYDHERRHDGSSAWAILATSPNGSELTINTWDRWDLPASLRQAIEFCGPEDQESRAAS